jgi:hypothetical protein
MKLGEVQVHQDEEFGRIFVAGAAGRAPEDSLPEAPSAAGSDPSSA